MGIPTYSAAMWSPTRGLPRGLRAASLGVVGFVLALVAHVAAGGTAPPPAMLLALASLIALTALLVTGVRMTPLRVTMSLAAMQMVLHAAFMRLGVPADCSMTAVGPPTAGHLGHGSQPGLECAAGMAQAGLGQPSVLSASAMLFAHVAATAVMAALLAYGEKVLWFLASWVHPPRTSRVILSEPPAVPIMTSGAPRMFGLQLASGGVGRRGPPARGPFSIV